jgi:hypothetical protein
MEGGGRMRSIQVCWCKERLWKLVMRRSVITGLSSQEAGLENMSNPLEGTFVYFLAFERNSPPTSSYLLTYLLHGAESFLRS